MTSSLFDDFNDGDQVEVTLKGRLQSTPSYIRHGVTHYYVDQTWVKPESVQSVTLIEPEYEVGKIYVSRNGIPYYRLGGGDLRVWRRCDTGERAYHEVPIRPMRKLALES